MQPHLGLHDNSTEGFFLKNLYCLECDVESVRETRTNETHNIFYLISQA